MIGPADKKPDPMPKRGAGDDAIGKFIDDHAELIRAFFNEESMLIRVKMLHAIISKSFIGGTEIGTKMALALTGVDKDHPILKEIFKEAAKEAAKRGTKSLELVSCLCYCLANWAAAAKPPGTMGTICKQMIIPILEKEAELSGFTLPDPHDPMSFFNGPSKPWETN